MRKLTEIETTQDQNALETIVKQNLKHLGQVVPDVDASQLQMLRRNNKLLMPRVPFRFNRTTAVKDKMASAERAISL